MKRLAIIASTCLFTISTFGAQVITVRNFADITIKASIKEPNSILLKDDRIQQMKAPANTLMDTCNGKANCKLIDDATGILTFLPSVLFHTRPFTINLQTEKGYFYNVRIEPKPIPSQTIVLKAWQKPLIRAIAPQTSGYERMMVSFLKALVNGQLPEGFTQTIPKRRETYQAKRTEIRRLLSIRGNDLRGDVFELKNRTNKELDVKESWFNWPATRGIALAKTHLAPFEKTRLYRIS